MAECKFVIFLKLYTTLSVAKNLCSMHVVQLAKRKKPKTIQIQFTACLGAGGLNVEQ